MRKFQLAPLARYHFWNISRLGSIFLIKAISWVLRTKVIYEAKCENFGSLRSHVSIFEISHVSDLFFWSKPYHEYYEQKSLLYRHNMWLTTKCWTRYQRIVRFKRQNVKISARSLRSLVIIHDIYQVSALLIRLAISWVLRT